MKIKYTGSYSTIRTFLVATLAFGLTLVTTSISYAGPAPPTCHLFCTLDKKCSVGGSAPQDSCTAEVGDEVTYTYHVQSGNWIWQVVDNKLGVIGETTGETLTRTTTLTETTTNYASMTSVGYQDPPPYPGNECICWPFEGEDSVTVTIPTPTPTPPSPCVTAWPRAVVFTQAKGQSPANNAKLTHRIYGNIIDPSSLGDTVHRIEICAGTEVRTVVTDTTGAPVNTALGSFICSPAACVGVVNENEKYQSISQDGRDKDAITFIPK